MANGTKLNCKPTTEREAREVLVSCSVLLGGVMGSGRYGSI